MVSTKLKYIQRVQEESRKKSNIQYDWIHKAIKGCTTLKFDRFCHHMRSVTMTSRSNPQWLLHGYLTKSRCSKTRHLSPSSGVCTVGKPGGQMPLPVLLGGPIITIHSDCQHGLTLTLPSAASELIQIPPKKGMVFLSSFYWVCAHTLLLPSDFCSWRTKVKTNVIFHLHAHSMCCAFWGAILANTLVKRR